MQSTDSRTMTTIHTLSSLLKQSGCHYHILDLGRKVQPIAATDFEKIELGCQPYPYPIQRQAKFAIVYWNETQQPWIWFLCFHLDERGLLQATDIGQLIQYILEAMGTRLGLDLTEGQQDKLANNPYIFQPAEDKMAVFHSQVRMLMKQPASPYYEHAQQYFQGKLSFQGKLNAEGDLSWDNWQTVGLQGITDMCARLGQDQNASAILKSLDHLPSEPCYALLGALEHSQLSSKLANRLQAMANDEMSRPEPDRFYLSALIRALSGAPEQQLQETVKRLFNTPALCHPEILIGLAGRCWSVFTQEHLAERFLIRLAETQQQALFNQLFADLVMLPDLRVILLPLLHTQASPELESALVFLQQSAKGSTSN